MDLPQEAIGPLVSCVSVAVFLRKPIATCDFSGRVRTPFSTLNLWMLLEVKISEYSV